MDNHASEIIMY